MLGSFMEDRIFHHQDGAFAIAKEVVKTWSAGFPAERDFHEARRSLDTHIQLRSILLMPSIAPRISGGGFSTLLGRR
jgi:hypothetical protein